MGNLKEVRVRISSVSSTQQITKAMKMVSAAKLRRAQDAIIQMRPYSQKLSEILDNLSESMGSEGGPYAVSRTATQILIVAITSNRGLCGAFNSAVIRQVNGMLNGIYAASHKEGKVKILCIGKKASDYYSKSPAYLGQFNDLFNQLTFQAVSEIASGLMKDFADEKYDRVHLVYNQFKNAATQIIQNELLMPVGVQKNPKASGNAAKRVDYIFEPAPQDLVLELVPKAIRTKLFKAILDSHASEHGARMTAMNKATDNASELIKQLKLSYNKARQAAITAEILEIVGGAEALKG